MAIGTNTSILWGDTMSKVRSSITMASDSWKDESLSLHQSHSEEM